MSDQPVIHSNPNILGGTPVFVGTRVPVAVLELAKTMLIAHARAA